MTGRWEAVIGLEVHVQLATASKAFSASSASYGAEPNSLTDPTVLGLPGALPTFNQQALQLALRLGLATGCTIRRHARFARKHYFYPDLPKGYQISQYDEPLCEHGALEFWWDGAPHRVRLTRIHLEEDAGKSIHQGNASLVDLNRAGVPLVEVVSEPDLRSAAEAAEYMRALHQLVRYLGISEGNMEQGHLRCDANVSLRPRGASQLGTRTELKNINSFRFVQRAIEHEIARQARLLDAGGQVVQETRLWDADLGTSQPMRGKEEAEDYRYFPDPDLPPLVVDEARIAGIRETLPELPMAVLARYTSAWGLGVEDARLLCSEPALARYYEACVAAHGRPETGAKPLANWIQAELLRELKDSGTDISACPVTPERLAELVTLIEAGTLSGKMAKQVFSTMYRSGESPRAIVEREGLVQLSDESQLLELGRQILAANPAQVQQYRSGKHNLLGFFVGQFMKQTRGQANPQLVNQLLRRLLDQG